MSDKKMSNSAKISKIEVTDEKLSGRGGVFFVLKYIENTRFYQLFEQIFGSLKGSSKGLSCFQWLKQLLAFFIDGTDMSMKSFDLRKEDEAYAALLENTADEMASSHQMKRFFRKLILIPNLLYRKILLYLFIWRLHQEQPEIIVLFGDSMVLDNDDALKRQGVEPTYKNKKGFQPLQISWGGYIIDAIFRSGSTHGNHGSDFMKAIARIVRAIREKYRDVPIILLTDSGFMDEQNFRFFEERLKIHYICAGKQYDDLKQYVEQLPADQFNSYCNQKQSWQYVEFGNRLKSWDRFRRCIFTTLESEENGQMNLEFVRTDSFIYTNLGQDEQQTQRLIEAGGAKFLDAEEIIRLNHSRGKGELNHRSFKDFATKEQLPFKQFGMNRAFYYFMVISHFLCEAYKRDVTHDIISITIYPSAFRRQLIDFAVKIVSTGGRHVLKVTQLMYKKLNIAQIWERCQSPQPIFVT